MKVKTDKHENRISEAEWQVMRVVWSEEGLTSSEIIKKLSDDFDWKAGTIKTLLNRLLNKSYLWVEQEKNKYFYFSRISEFAHLKTEMSSILENVCATKHGELLLALTDEIELSKDDIKRLIEVLEQKLTTAEEKVNCKCNPGQCNC